MSADDSFRPGSTAGPGDTPRGPRLLDCVRHTARARHLAASTEKAYVHWAKRYVLFHRKRHPLEMGEREVNEFLTHLAVNAHVPHRRRIRRSRGCCSCTTTSWAGRWTV